MELLQLRYFCDAAQTENFSQTAREYQVPTSNISQTIKRLESELGTELFHRRKNHIFLNEQGRCRIHSFRPGLCRLFPLGRVYDEEGFKYYVQLYECPKPVKTKVKIDKWLGIPDIKRYEEFVLAWHWLQKWCQELIEQAPDLARENVRKKIATSLLSIFYMTPYDGKLSFYDQFMARRDLFVRQIQ